jgi:hypothetical protein
MADLSARPDVPASSTRVAELHQLARQDYTKGQQERASVPNLLPTYAVGVHVPEPSDLDVAISVAQQLLDTDQILSLREALRLLLRALGAEPVDPSFAAEFPTIAAHLADEREAGR